jgi:hypothetical protein
MVTHSFLYFVRVTKLKQKQIKTKTNTNLTTKNRKRTYMQKENQTNKQKTAIALVLKRIKTDTDMMSIVHINEMFTSLGYCLRDKHILLHTQYLYIYVVKHWEKKTHTSRQYITNYSNKGNFSGKSQTALVDNIPNKNNQQHTNHSSCKSQTVTIDKITVGLYCTRQDGFS